jgi:hypothetical protein
MFWGIDIMKFNITEGQLVKAIKDSFKNSKIVDVVTTYGLKHVLTINGDKFSFYMEHQEININPKLTTLSMYYNLEINGIELVCHEKITAEQNKIIEKFKKENYVTKEIVNYYKSKVIDQEKITSYDLKEIGPHIYYK